MHDSVGRKTRPAEDVIFAVALIRAGFEPVGLCDVAVIAGIIGGFWRRLAETHQRRGSKPARDKLIAKPHRQRAEFFALAIACALVAFPAF